jgi:hypothetical protein
MSGATSRSAVNTSREANATLSLGAVAAERSGFGGDTSVARDRATPYA